MENSIYLSITRVWVSLKTQMIITSFAASEQLCELLGGFCFGIFFFFVTKSIFSLKSILSSFQTLEGDAQTSGDTAWSIRAWWNAQLLSHGQGLSPPLPVV